MTKSTTSPKSSEDSAIKSGWERLSRVLADCKVRIDPNNDVVGYEAVRVHLKPKTVTTEGTTDAT